jgi:hypothetical protein
VSVMCTLLLQHDSETWAITISAQKTHDIGQEEMWAQTMNQITHPEEWRIIEYRVTPL